MAKFLVRVELHGADWDDYETLHAEMAWPDRRFLYQVK